MITDGAFSNQRQELCAAISFTIVFKKIIIYPRRIRCSGWDLMEFPNNEFLIRCCCSKDLPSFKRSTPRVFQDCVWTKAGDWTGRWRFVSLLSTPAVFKQQFLLLTLVEESYLGWEQDGWTAEDHRLSVSQQISHSSFGKRQKRRNLCNWDELHFLYICMYMYTYIHINI